MNKNKQAIIIAILTILGAPLYADKYGDHGHYGHYGYGHGSDGAWIAPAVIGTTLAGTAIGAAASKPQTVIVQQSDHENLKNTVKKLQRENKLLRKKVKQLEKKLDKFTQQTTTTKLA